MSEMKSNGTAEKKTAGTSAKNKSAPQAQFRSGAVSGEYQKDRAGPERTAKRKTAGKAASSDYQRTADHSTAQEQFQSGTAKSPQRKAGKPTRNSSAATKRKKKRAADIPPGARRRGRGGKGVVTGSIRAGRKASAISDSPMEILPGEAIS